MLSSSHNSWLLHMLPSQQPYEVLSEPEGKEEGGSARLSKQLKRFELACAESPTTSLVWFSPGSNIHTFSTTGKLSWALKSALDSKWQRHEGKESGQRPSHLLRNACDICSIRFKSRSSILCKCYSKKKKKNMLGVSSETHKHSTKGKAIQGNICLN